jgi:hypothetical protein
MMCVGKTMWIHYLVRRCVGEERPVALYLHRQCYRLSKSGVHIIEQDFLSRVPEPMWCIIDSAESPTGIPQSMMEIFSPGNFPIYVSSPAKRRWEKLDQSKTRHVIIMNPWTMEEMDLA